MEALQSVHLQDASRHTSQSFSNHNSHLSTAPSLWHNSTPTILNDLSNINSSGVITNTGRIASLVIS